MYHHHATKKPLGFTLVELAIVLAVTGVLFVGLYRLLSGGNQQVKDTAAASQQIQLINAVKTFLGSSDGAQWMGAKAIALAGSPSPGIQKFNLPLPAYNANLANYNTLCKNNLGAQLGSFCDALPTGFSAATVNAYGQQFLIYVQTSAFATPATVPATYSFMIETTGGETIPDPDGGRIVSQIGTDGGFIYSPAGVASGVCGNGMACGAFGAWTASPITDYGFPTAPSGHIASRTYYAPEIGSTIPWLARNYIDTVPNAPPFNTMHTDLFLGANSNTSAPNNFWLGADSSLTTGGGTVNLQNGSLTDLHITPTPGNNTGSVSLSVDLTQGTNYVKGANLVTLTTNCSIDQSTATAAGLQYNGTDQVNSPGNVCKSGLIVSGDANIAGLLQAESLYSGKFIYQAGGGASDIRLKKDILPISSALQDVMRMKPVSYAFKSNGDKSLGFIAQDMEKIYPQLVIQDGAGMKAIKYDGLIAPLVSSVQELKRENEELRQQLHEQALRQERLEQRLNQQQP